MTNKRCLHQRGLFTELSAAIHERAVIGGTMAETGHNDIGEITGYEYFCLDCNRAWKVDSISSFKPKWLKKIADQLANEVGI